MTSLPALDGTTETLQYVIDRLASSGIDTGGRKIRVRFGIGAAVDYNFTASTVSAAATINHGMGTAPQIVVVQQFGGPVAGFTASITALSSSSFTTQASIASATTGHIFGFWVAIG